MCFEKGSERAVCWEVILFLSDQETGNGSSLSRDTSVDSYQTSVTKPSLVISIVLLVLLFT